MNKSKLKTKYYFLISEDISANLKGSQAKIKYVITGTSPYKSNPRFTAKLNDQ